MLGIFDDEWAGNGQIRTNPEGTRPISPLDGVGKRLKCRHYGAFANTTSDEIGHACTAILSVHRPNGRNDKQAERNA